VSAAGFGLTREQAAGIRLLATDLDGTLLRDDQSVSPRTQAAVAAATAAGIEVVFATGRPPRWLPAVIDASGHHAAAIVANGAAMLDPGTATLTDLRPIPTETVHAVTTRLRERLPEVAFAIEHVPAAGAVWDHEGVFTHEPHYRPHWQPPHPVTVGDLAGIVGQRGALKLIGRLTDQRLPAEELRDLTHEVVGTEVEVTLSDPRLQIVEMGATGVNKGTAVARLAARRGWGPASVAAVGDMVNDLSMLTWAGHPFIVTNAHARLHALGATRLPTNEEDGVAILLETLVELRG